MELITSVTVGSGGAASVTLPATGTIPQTYTDLYLVMSARSNRSGGQPADGFLIKPNNTTPTIKYISGEGSGTPFSGTSYSGIVPTISATASTFGSCSAYFPNYANTSNHKSFSVDDVSENNGTIAYATLSANLYSSNSAITTIVVESINAASFVEHSTFYLYGISNVTSTTKATGGIVSSDGTYNYHMFPYSGTFTPTAAISADVLCIAGGGGGGTYYSGGGGAGGLLYLASQSFTATGYTVTVGAGGAAQSSNFQAGNSGSNSSVQTFTAAVGGGGGGGSTIGSPGAERAALTGGSGGGGAQVYNGAAGTAGQGNAGGNAGTNGGGGGGGAGAAGTAGNPSNGAGGIGVNTYASWANATQTGVDGGYYAGGGGGWGTGDNGIGGLGGGGSYVATFGQSGKTNTGGGGAGGTGGSSIASGGSGLVIIRYAI